MNEPAPQTAEPTGGTPDAGARFRALTEYATQLVAILDDEGTFRYHNPASVRILGIPAEELIGTSAFALVHPDDHPAMRGQYERMRRTPDEVVSAHFRVRHRDGSWRTLEADGRNLAHDPCVRGYLFNARDVTGRVRTEERLRESEERYRLVTRASNDVLWDWDLSSGRVYWGESLGAVLGYSAADVESDEEWWSSRIHPDDRERVDGGLADAVRRADVWSDEYRFRRANAAYAVIYDRAVIQRDEAGRATRVVGSMQDLTEKRLAETELRAMFLAMQDVIFVIDAEGRYRKVAPSNPPLLLHPPDQLVGRTFHDVLPREQADLFLERVREALRTESPVHYEYGLVIRGAPTWFSATISPMTEDTVVWVAHDVTERRTAREALEQSEAWFRSLTQNAIDIVTVLDAEGRVRYSTPSGARVLRFEPAELRGRPIVEIVHPEDQPRLLAALEGLVADGAEPVTLDVRVQAKDGSWQVHQAIAQSLLHDPAVRGIVVNSHDVTEQRRLEAQLRQAQKMEAVGRLAGGVAHDFNNVLMAISGFAALLEAEIDLSGGDAMQYLAEIQKATDRAASLTRQLLAFGRKQALRPKVVNLTQVVEGAGPMLRRLIREDVDLAFRLDARTGQCRVDPHQVEQVLVNLVVNAADAMPDGGTLEITTRNRLVTEHDRWLLPYVHAGSYIALCVRDSGHGMDAETLGQVFEPFFTTKEVGKGTGLGLSTVYGIVKQSGGYVWGESEPGQGSAFNVIFPRVQTEAEETAGIARRKRAPGHGTVLLAEDEDAVRLLARLTLQKAGYTVLEARDGVEALRIADGHGGPIDLLLTDVIMPHLGGYSLAEQLRARRPSVQVVYMSGYVGRPLGQPSHLSAADFLAKPVTPELLTRKVREAMDRAERPGGPTE